MPSNAQVIDIAPGLWIWRLAHPGWKEGVDWQRVVTCVCVDAGQERWLLDPLLPPEDATEVWDRLARRAPTAVAIIIPDHLRETATDRKTWSIDAVVDRYGARAFGPRVWDPDQGPPKSAVHTIRPGDELPGGLRALRSPRGNEETPLWLPEQRALVFADGMTAQDGALRIWDTDHLERVLPELRAMLELPFEHVLVSHGDPVHTREDFIAALDREPYRGES